MIAYCDTSALMKLFITEQHSARMQRESRASQRLMVSLLTWTEMLAALALKKRTAQIDALQMDRALQELESEWPRYHQISVDAELAAHAGQLALRFGLRAYDSIQLASAHRAHQQIGASLMFLCFDKQLNAAASHLGMQVLAG